MPLIFANPAGWFALLAIPVILLVHFLQRESRQLAISTLFLLEQLSPVSAQGRRFERLRNSLPLWLQLLAALLLTWLLLQPRWLRKDSVQNITVILDSSISMSAFREPMERTLIPRLTALSRAAARTDWRLLESDTTRGTLYAGFDFERLQAALHAWRPHLGTHDFAPACRIAQSLARENSLIIFVSDRRADLSEGIRLFTVGVPVENCGFAGLRVDRNEWHTLVKNYGTIAQTRTWSVQAGPPVSLTIEPGKSIALAGKFPPDSDRCELVLSSDLFPVDDRLPIVRPKPKPLAIQTQPGTPFADLWKQFLGTIDNVETAATSDIGLTTYDPLAPQIPPAPSIVFLAEPTEPPKYLTGPILAEDNPLVAELNWQGLLCKDTLRVPPREGDEVLVWQGERPLVFFRGESLIVNFDVRYSNALRLPAFVLALHRYVERIRAQKTAPETRNVETNQLLSEALPAGWNGQPARRNGNTPDRDAQHESMPHPVPPGGSPDGTGESPVPPMQRAPSEPGFFDAPLLTAAAHFADAREADFREAATIDELGNATAAQAERNTRADFLAPLWAILLAFTLLANWRATSNNPSPSGHPERSLRSEGSLPSR